MSLQKASSGIVLALMVSFALAGAANAGASNRLGNGPRAMAPLGFQVFCLKNPSQCRSAGKAEIAYDASVLSALEGVNRRVNRAINYKSDGRRDTWSLNVSRGDCEDYVLAKRKRLVEGGMPASALRIAYVKTNRGIDHAILIVKTSDGDLVLDNLTNRIKPFEQTGLRMVAMSSSDPMRWTAY